MDLELATTDELIEELKRRFTSVVFAGIRDSHTGENSDVRFSVYSGGLERAIGLCRSVEHKLLVAMDSCTTHEEE